MNIAITGATGFLGHYIVQRLLESGNSIKAWYRDEAKLDNFVANPKLSWVKGQLNDQESTIKLLDNTDALVHAALYRPGPGFIGAEGSVVDFAQHNILGSLRLFEAAKKQGVRRVIFISTCAVHDIIMTDRDLDEAHPLWPKSHYGAHKAAIEKFVHSFGLGDKFEICSLRPTGIYGLATPIENSKWFSMIQDIKKGKDVEVTRGGKEVHAADVAKAVDILLTADKINGQSFNCYDRYISQFDVASITKELTNSDSKIIGEQKRPINQIQTSKIQELGMRFGGDSLFHQTIQQLLDSTV